MCAGGPRDDRVRERGAAGDLSAFWDHYQDMLGRSKHEGKLKVTSNEEVSLEMIEPAMQVVYDLPTRE